MTVADLKHEIHKALDSAPESVLTDILDYLRLIQDTPKEKVDLSLHLSSILRQDKELLQRLAL
jgi:hypothetical protein